MHNCLIFYDKMDGLILDYYGIAEESVSFDGVKKRIDQIIMTVRNWIQRVVNWVSMKFMNFMNMDQVQIGQKYYNDIMGTIKSILNVDSKGIDKFVMDFNTIRNNPEGVKKAGENIAKRLQDLEDLAENMKKITPSENDHLLTLSQSGLKSFQSQLYDLRDEAQRKLQCIKGTGGERTIHKIKDKLSTLYDKYTSEAKRLNMKANELAKKEAANNPPKEEKPKDELKASESTTFWDVFLTACEEA